MGKPYRIIGNADRTSQVPDPGLPDKHLATMSPGKPLSDSYAEDDLRAVIFLQGKNELGQIVDLPVRQIRCSSVLIIGVVFGQNVFHRRGTPIMQVG